MESPSFLFDCGFGWYDLGPHAEVGPTIAYFSTVALDGGRNSFNRQSLCATAGWLVENALAGDPDSPVRHELDAIQPAWAVVMYGTNDLDHIDVDTYRADLSQLLDIVESYDVVAVMTTIPPRLDTAAAGALVGPFNDVVRSLAGARHLPLVDLWSGLSALPDDGLIADGIHPSSDGNACYFTDAEMRYGYNVRNLLTLQMLERLRGL
jgi:lysophospholipase L1-like esterase